MKKEKENLLGERLAKLRTERGLTQEGLAKLAHVGQSTIAGIESGARATVPGSLIDIAHALKVDAYFLRYGIKTLVAGDRMIDEVVDLMRRTDKAGKSVVLDKAVDMAKQYPLSKSINAQ